MPNEFTDLIGSFTAAEASIGKLFNREQDGVGIRSLAARGGPKYQQRLAEAAKFIGTVFDGHRPMWQLKEALSTDDFPLLFGDTLDRMLLAKFKAITPTWQQYMKVTTTIRDFRGVERFRASIGAGMTEFVGQGGDYRSDTQTESHYSFKVAKYGRRRDILWEVLQNDDLGALQDTPGDLARQAANREAYFASSLYVGNTTLFGNHTAADGKVYVNKLTAELNAENLAAAIGTMGEFPGDDTDGMPIINDPLYLVVGTRAMQFKAEQILNSLVVTTTKEGLTNQPTVNLLPVEIRNRMKVVVDPYMRMSDPTNYQTSWYLFADPADGWAIEVGYLVGHESPELYMKAANQIRLGGGVAIEGDFDTDARSYKILHVVGGSHSNAVGGWRFAVWSDGTGL